MNDLIKEAQQKPIYCTLHYAGRLITEAKKLRLNVDFWLKHGDGCYLKLK